MKCTLPEPDRSGWDSRDYYDDVISELWEVLNLVEKMRAAQWAFDMITGEEDIEYIDKLQIVKREAEREVDEILKKMEEQ